MIVPTTRWFVVAAFLALAALLALVAPWGATAFVIADGLWIVALIIDVFRVGGFDERALEVTRRAPPAFSVGRAFDVVYRWLNTSSRSWTVRVREDVPAALGEAFRAERSLTLAPGQVTIEHGDVKPIARGKIRTGALHIRLLAPWGLAWRQVVRPLPWDTTVFPRLTGAALRALPTQTLRRREAGLRNVRRLGEGRVFESLREFVPGDDTRTIDWKATAKRGKAMARQFEDERRQQLLLVLDAGRLLTAEVDGRARLESAIEAALSLAYAAVDHDDNVGLMVFADDIQSYVAPSRGKGALRKILDALATAEGKLVEPNYPLAFATLATKNRKRALTVLFTDVVDRTASDALVAQASTLRPRHLPLAVAIRNPELDRLALLRPRDSAAAFERAAAEEMLQAREEGLADMRSRGILVLDVTPTGAAKAVVDQYTQLKRRAMI